jgi:hypothetical protein
VEEDRGARNVCERETTIPDKSAFSASTRPRRVKRRTFPSRRFLRAGLACGRASPLARASDVHVPSPGWWFMVAQGVQNQEATSGGIIGQPVAVR